MNKTLALLLVATLVGIYAVTEIQELGNANADAVKSSDVATSDDAEDNDLGEDVGRRGGAFLSTTGSFTLSSGSNTAGSDEEDDELGEDDGVGRRGGAFLSTTGSFTLSSGSNTAGNDEEDEM